MILQGRAFGTEAFEILNDSLDSTVSASGFAVVELIYMNFSKSVALTGMTLYWFWPLCVCPPLQSLTVRGSSVN